MQRRKLGRQGFEVSEIGLGCMGMTWAYGPSDETEALRVLDRAYELGINFWDSAEIYGPYRNEELLGRALKSKARDRVVIATKFAFRFGPAGERILDSSPAHIKRTIEGSLKRLGTDYIDLYYQHRLDPNTPIEDTIGALADLVRAGKARAIGLSEVGAAVIRRAHAVYPITAIQSEYSLWERGVEKKVLPTLRELGIGFVAYSPIGRGFLTGTIKSASQLDQSDFRRNHPRFEDENLARNFKIVGIIQTIASAHRVTPAQLALAWVLRQGENIVPIPGTKHLQYLQENAKAVDVNLPEPVWSELDRAASDFRTAGARYPDHQMKLIDAAE